MFFAVSKLPYYYFDICFLFKKLPEMSRRVHYPFLAAFRFYKNRFLLVMRYHDVGISENSFRLFK